MNIQTRVVSRIVNGYKVVVDVINGKNYVGFESYPRTVVSEVPCLDYFTGTYNSRPVEFALPVGLPIGAEPEMIAVTFLDVGEVTAVEVATVPFADITTAPGSFSD